jgi:AcrR family transcriptional regulator
VTTLDIHDRPLRADAKRNRARILAAAGELFADRGVDASLEEVAARAEVGIGTLYRHFGDRDGLIDALFEERIEETAAVAERALEIEDPWEGFEFFLREASARQVADRGLRDAVLSPGRGGDRAARARGRIAPLAARILERARADGRLREDLEAFDIPMLQQMLGAVADLTRQVEPELWQRFLGILLDGLRASREAPTPLACEALDADRYASAMARRQPAARSR